MIFRSDLKRFYNLDFQSFYIQENFLKNFVFKTIKAIFE